MRAWCRLIVPNMRLLARTGYFAVVAGIWDCCACCDTILLIRLSVCIADSRLARILQDLMPPMVVHIWPLNTKGQTLLTAALSKRMLQVLPMHVLRAKCPTVSVVLLSCCFDAFGAAGHSGPHQS